MTSQPPPGQPFGAPATPAPPTDAPGPPPAPPPDSSTPPPPPSYWGTPEPPPGPAPGWRYGGFWIRLVAYLIDSIPIVIVTILVIAPFFGAMFDALRDIPLPPPDATVDSPEYQAYQRALERAITDAMAPFYPAWGLLQLLSAAYFVGFWTWRGQTPGMMLLGLRVAREADGAKPGFARSILRYVGYFISSFLLGLGFLWIAFDRRKQGWHDKIAGTVVVRPAA